MPVALTLAERETRISMMADDRSTWSIGSDDPVWQGRFEAIGATLVSQVGEWKEYTLPANQISLRNPSKPMSEERKAQNAERLRAYRAAHQIIDAETLKLASYDDEGDGDE